MTELKAARQLELVATSHPVKYSDLLSSLIIGVEANYVALLVNVQLWPLVRRNSDFVGSMSVIFELLCYSSEVFVQPGCRAAAERESAGREADRGKNNGKHAVPGLPVHVLVQPALTLLVSVKPSKKKKQDKLERNKSSCSLFRVLRWIYFKFMRKVLKMKMKWFAAKISL